MEITQTAGNFCKDGVIMVAVNQINMIQTVKHLMLFCNYVISLLINRRSWRGYGKEWRA